MLHKVVDLNKKVIEKKEPKKKEKVEIRNLYESDEESDDQPLEHPVANNPATTDENRKTRINMVLKIYNKNYDKYHFVELPLEENEYIKEQASTREKESKT